MLKFRICIKLLDWNYALKLQRLSTHDYGLDFHIVSIFKSWKSTLHLKTWFTRTDAGFRRRKGLWKQLTGVNDTHATRRSQTFLHLTFECILIWTWSFPQSKNLQLAAYALVKIESPSFKSLPFRWSGGTGGSRRLPRRRRRGRRRRRRRGGQRGSAKAPPPGLVKARAQSHGAEESRI